MELSQHLTANPGPASQGPPSAMILFHGRRALRRPAQEAPLPLEASASTSGFRTRRAQGGPERGGSGTAHELSERPLRAGP